MRIGIVGSGRLGSAIAHLLVAAGHEVAISNSRGPASLSEAVASLGETAARAASVERTAAFGDVVLLAIPLHACGGLPADAFAGTVVIDATNYDPDRDGHVAALVDGRATSSELLAAHLPDARVVKAFNTMSCETLMGEGMPGAPRHQRLALLVAGDDAQAKALVGALIDELGFAAVDTGSLADSAVQQPGSELCDVALLAPEAELKLAKLRT